jgi:hypothetical protein
MHNKAKKSTKFAAVGFGLAVAVSFGIGLQEARSADAPSPWPLQLEMRVPFEPAATILPTSYISPTSAQVLSRSAALRCSTQMIQSRRRLLLLKQLNLIR